MRCSPDHPALFRHDSIREQVGEWIESREPGVRRDAARLSASVDAVLGSDPDSFGAWFHYPWSGRLVHVLGEAEFRRLRTDRNRFKITSAEQASLARARIGIVGLSVGQSAAFTLAMEGVGGMLRIADFDTLSLSNMNRLHAGVHEIGLSKAVLAARRLAEMDPWLSVEIVPEGVTEAGIDAFFDGIDLLVEECDDLWMKLRMREAARARGIPVVMDTSDRGLFDVERFDLEPARPLLHGLLGEIDVVRLRGLESKDKVPYILRILGEDRLSPRMIASLPEVKETLSTWPQLASGVALGGALVADVVRRILLRTFTESGRFYVDVEAIIADGAGSLRRAVEPAPPESPSPESRRVPVLVGEDWRETILSYAIAAPSAHNQQPWRFVWHGDTLEAWRDADRSKGFLDLDHSATWLAFGAVWENVVLGAGTLGRSVEAECFAAPDLPLRLTFSGGTAPPDPLADAVALRCTNRRRDGASALSDADGLALGQAATVRGASLSLCRAELPALAELMGRADQRCLLDPRIHKETFDGFRWTRDSVLSTRDGLDVHTLELTASESAAMRLMRDPDATALLRAESGGSAFRAMAREHAKNAAAMGLLVVPGTDRLSYLRGGRAMQRMWLTATQRGLAIHPLTTLPYLFARAERREDLDDDWLAELAEMRRHWLAIFPTPPGHAELLLFRIAHAGPPTARSLRRGVHDVVAPG